MGRAIHKIAQLLLAVVLATVLSPSYGWETAASQAGHGHEVAGIDGLDAHDGHPGHPDQHHDGEDSHHHHGCAGHQLGHMQGQASGAFVVASNDAIDGIFAEPPSDFPSVAPRRLDRPPLSPDLA